jgi:hypothetical protein
VTTAKARDRVTKLLALASRPGTPAEGENALRRATKLAAEHGWTVLRNSRTGAYRVAGSDRGDPAAQRNRSQADAQARRRAYEEAARTAGDAFRRAQRESSSSSSPSSSGAGQRTYREDGAAHASATTETASSCDYCGATIWHRAEGRPPRFCTPSHRVAWHRQQRGD